MKCSRSVGIYRELLLVYPRSFRDKYRDDMALVFADQLRDDPTGRVWARGVVDLAITIPARHLEAHMNRPPNPTVPLVYGALSVTGVVFAIVGGSSIGIAAIALALAVVAGYFAVASWRTTRAVTEARPAAARWWQVLLGGVGVLTTTIVAVNIIGEVPDAWWLPMMITLLAGIMTTATGLILGITHLATHRPRNATG